MYRVDGRRIAPNAPGPGEKDVRPCQLLAVSATVSVLATWACGSSPSQPTPPVPPPCAFQLTASITSLGFQGGAVSISVSTAAGCAWTARADAEWVTIQSGASGTGPGTIAISVGANPDASSRDSLVAISDQSVKLTQQGRTPCTYALTPDDARFGPEGGAGQVTIAAPSHCAWTAGSSDAWIAFVVASGTGDGVVSFTVAAWSGTAERSATIRVEDQTVSVRQSRDPRACVYAVTPVELVLHWHGPGGQVTVTTDADCTWTVGANADWLEVSGPRSRRGSGAVQFISDALTSDSTRRATIELRWPTPSAGQNVRVTQEGCRYGVYPQTVAFPAAGGTGSINVLTQPISPSCSLGCPWTAEPSASWIRIASGSPGSGDNPFHIEVSPNTGAARSGTIRVAGHTVTISQAGS
jgi:hypothetical protein